MKKLMPILTLPFFVSALSADVRITIYNDNIGLINEVRKFDMNKGRVELRFEDVAATIDPTSVSFIAEGVSVVEQNFEYDLVSVRKLYEKYIGREIFFDIDLGEGTRERKRAVLLSVSDGIIIEMDNKIWIDPPGGIVLPELPEGLILKPSLVWLLDVTRGGKRRVEISYLADGINWHADYVGIMNEDDTEMKLEAWVTITNHTGTTFKDANLKVVAGAVRRVERRRPIHAKAEMIMRDVAPPRFEERRFFEYHLYDLKEKTTIRSDEVKQIRFLNPTRLKTEKRYIYDGTRHNRVQVKLEFENSKKNRLGIPLPEGRVRVYKRDRDAALLFAGEDRIEHTPRDETVRLYIGDAFDIVGERKVIDRKKIAERVREETYQIEIRNRKDEKIRVQVVERPGGYWEVVQTSHKYEKKDTNTIEFSLNVPGGEEEKLIYTVRYSR